MTTNHCPRCTTLEAERDTARQDAAAARFEVARVTEAATVAYEVAESERKELEAALEAADRQHEEDEQFIDALGQVCCGVAFTNGQHEEANEHARTHSECAFCREVGPRTAEAMRAHMETCTKHPYATARTEADDFRRAWAILDEPNSGLRIHTGETAADVARAFVDSRSLALSERDTARAERDEARRAYEEARTERAGYKSERDGLRSLLAAAQNERDEAKAQLATLRTDMQAVSTEDERGHAIIDAADDEEPDSTSADTLADRVERLVQQRDEARAARDRAEARAGRLRAACDRVMAEIGPVEFRSKKTDMQEAMNAAFWVAKEALAATDAECAAWLDAKLAEARVDERSKWSQSHEALGARCDVYQRRVVELVEALTCWGVHDVGCPGKAEGLDYCTCGLAAARTGCGPLVAEHDAKVAEARREEKALADSAWKERQAAYEYVVMLCEALRPLANTIADAAETDTEWEAVETAMNAQGDAVDKWLAARDAKVAAEVLTRMEPARIARDEAVAAEARVKAGREALDEAARWFATHDFDDCQCHSAYRFNGHQIAKMLRGSDFVSLATSSAMPAHKSPVTMMNPEDGAVTCDASDCWCRAPSATPAEGETT